MEYWNTKAERRERKKKNNRKMKVNGKGQAEFYKNAIEKKNKRGERGRREAEEYLPEYDEDEE